MKQGFKNLLIFLVIPSLLSIIFYNFTINHLLLSNVCFYLFLLMFFLIYSRKDLGENLKEFRKNFKKFIIIILKYSLSCFILMMIINYIIQCFFKNLPNNEVNNRLFLESDFTLSLIYLILIAPLLEEYIFRYSFREIKNTKVYIILTSFLFACLHLLSASSVIEFIYLIPYFIIGLGFSNIYRKTNNYFASVLGHALHNLLSVIIILIF